MPAASSPATFAGIHPSIIQTHILPHLDGPSLSAAAAASSYLHTLCSDHNLWSQICKSTWPSLTDPRLDHLISTFPAGHRSFFQDSFPALISDDNHRRSRSNRHPDCHLNRPSELISAVDIRYQNVTVYSRVDFTHTTTNFLSSPFSIEFNDDPNTAPPIDLNVDDPNTTLSHLKQSVSLNWILIDPTRKRTGNLSSIKPVVVKKHWMTDEIHLLYVTVLPGYDPTQMVRCRIKVTCAVGKGGVRLHVREVMLQIQDLDYRVVTGKEFLVITGRAIREENNVRRRKVVAGEEGERRYKVFKGMRREKMGWVKREEKIRETVIKVNNFFIMVLFLLFILQVYFHMFLK